MPFLIDGHNVIAALEDIDLDDPHDEAKLVMKLRAWTARVHRKAIVIFDGGIPGGPSRTLSTVDVKVVFAARHHTNADRIIRERLRALPDAPNWTVVSSDHEILDEAHLVGARTLTAQAFVDLAAQPFTPEKEKPDTISAAEVEAWLEIFKEPEEEIDSPSSGSPSPPRQRRPKRKKVRQSPPSHSQKPSPRRGHMHTIGEQMGIEAPPLPPSPPEAAEKPAEVSATEVESWLQVFHDDPESEVPPPNLPQRRPKPKSKRPERPIVRKEGGLSASEVDTWLSVFEDQATSEPAQDASSEPRANTSRADRKSGVRSRKVSPKLAKHQQQAAPTEDQETPNLSEEDLELWHRLFDDD